MGNSLAMSIERLAHEETLKEVQLVSLEKRSLRGVLSIDINS